MKLQLIVIVVVMFVSLNIMATPFTNVSLEENTSSTLFSKDIDMAKYGNNFQKRNIQLKKVDYKFSQRVEQSRRVSIVNGTQQVIPSTSQVVLQNNTWNGYARTGLDATNTQNSTFNRPMTIDAYSTRTQVTEAFADNDIIEINNMQKVGDEDTYEKEPGLPISDVVWGFLFCAVGYIFIRRRF